MSGQLLRRLKSLCREPVSLARLSAAGPYALVVRKNAKKQPTARFSSRINVIAWFSPLAFGCPRIAQVVRADKKTSGTVKFFLKFAVTRGTDNVSMPDNNSIGRSIQLDANRRRHAVTERTSQNFNVILRNTRQCRLTKEQVFRLWKCAVKDDDKLVDTAIEQLYEEMIAFDLARAETVMQLIIERHEAAAPTFRGLLQDIATSGLPKAGRSIVLRAFQRCSICRSWVCPEN